MRPLLRPALASALLLGASLVWAFRLASGATPWSPGSGALMGADLVALAGLSIVGMLVAGARWARRLGMAVAAAGLALAVAGPVDPWWWAGLVTGGAALASLAGTAFKGLVRERPAASGPPAEAVVLTLLLLAAPLVVGAAEPDRLHPLALAAATAVAAAGAWYSKAWAGALAAVRVGAPALLLAGALAVGWPLGLLVAAHAAAVARYAWTAGARVAVRPLVGTGTRVPIPPELAPREVLDAAGLDERGRRRER